MVPTSNRFINNLKAISNFKKPNITKNIQPATALQTAVATNKQNFYTPFCVYNDDKRDDSA